MLVTGAGSSGTEVAVAFPTVVSGGKCQQAAAVD